MADYATVANVKASLDITGTDYDTLLARIVTAASRWVDHVVAGGLENAFAATATATRAYGRAAIKGGTLYLDAPLLSLTSLTNGDDLPIQPADAVLHPLNERSKRQVRLKSTSGWSFLVDGLIEVEGVWGLYASGATPPAISEAATALAAWLFKRYQAGMSDATANYDLGSLVYSEAMPKQVAAMLLPFNTGPYL